MRKENVLGKSLTAFLLCFLAFSSFGQSNIFFNLSEFGAVPPTNRIITLQAASPFPANIQFMASDSNGILITNLNLGVVYNGVIKSPPAAINFEIFIPLGSGGCQDATNYVSVGGAQTFPAGQTAWSIMSSDARYARSGTSLSNTFYPLFSNPSNYVQNGTLLTASNYLQSQIVGGSITAAQVTNIVNGQTNGLATIVYVNSATNGLVTGTVTNGLSTVNYVNTATNGLVTGSITNGLATVAYVNNATNGLVTSGITNGFATVPYVNFGTNFVGTNSLAQLNNASNILQSQISNAVTNTEAGVSLGGTFTGTFTNGIFTNQTVFVADYLASPSHTSGVVYTNAGNTDSLSIYWTPYDSGNSFYGIQNARNGGLLVNSDAKQSVALQAAGAGQRSVVQTQTNNVIQLLPQGTMAQNGVQVFSGGVLSTPALTNSTLGGNITNLSTIVGGLVNANIGGSTNLPYSGLSAAAQYTIVTNSGYPATNFTLITSNYLSQTAYSAALAATNNIGLQSGLMAFQQSNFWATLIQVTNISVIITTNVITNSWALTGNAITNGTVLGTLNAQPLTIDVFGIPSLVLFSNLGGLNINEGWNNFIPNVESNATILSGLSNSVNGATSHNDHRGYDIVVGGVLNTNAGASFGLIGNGTGNKLTSSIFETILNGTNNSVYSVGWGTVVNGNNNQIAAYYGTVVNGSNNYAGDREGFIGNGESNIIGSGAQREFIGDGLNNINKSDSSAILDGISNSIIDFGHGEAIIGGQFNSIAASGYGSTAIGSQNKIVSNDNGYNNGSIIIGYSNVVNGSAGNIVVGSGSAASFSSSSPSNAIAIGTFANSSNDAAIVINDGSVTFSSYTNHSLSINELHGTGINTNNASGNALNVSGNANVSGIITEYGIPVLTNGTSGFVSQQGSYTNGIIQSNLALGGLPTWTYTTNAVGIRNAGVVAANGTYQVVTAGEYTNTLGNGSDLSFQNPSWFIRTNNGAGSQVNLYSATTLGQGTTWANVVGGSQVPTSSYGYSNDFTGVIPANFNASALTVGTIPTGVLTSGSTNTAGHLLVVTTNAAGQLIRDITYNGALLTNIQVSGIGLGTASALSTNQVVQQLPYAFFIGDPSNSVIIYTNANTIGGITMQFPASTTYGYMEVQKLFPQLMINGYTNYNTNFLWHGFTAKFGIGVYQFHGGIIVSNNNVIEGSPYGETVFEDCRPTNNFTIYNVSNIVTHLASSFFNTSNLLNGCFISVPFQTNAIGIGNTGGVTPSPNVVIKDLVIAETNVAIPIIEVYCDAENMTIDNVITCGPGYLLNKNLSSQDIPYASGLIGFAIGGQTIDHIFNCKSYESADGLIIDSLGNVDVEDYYVEYAGENVSANESTVYPANTVLSMGVGVIARRSGFGSKLNFLNTYYNSLGCIFYSGWDISDYSDQGSDTTLANFDDGTNSPNWITPIVGQSPYLSHVANGDGLWNPAGDNVSLDTSFPVTAQNWNLEIYGPGYVLSKNNTQEFVISPSGIISGNGAKITGLTNGLATTAYVNNATNGFVSNGGIANGAGFTNLNILRDFTTSVDTTAVSQNATNLMLPFCATTIAEASTANYTNLGYVVNYSGTLTNFTVNFINVSGNAIGSSIVLYYCLTNNVIDGKFNTALDNSSASGMFTNANPASSDWIPAGTKLSFVETDTAASLPAGNDYRQIQVQQMTSK